MPPKAISKVIRGSNFSVCELDTMLTIAETNVPIGINMWNDLASEFNALIGGSSNRTGEGLRNKFKALKNHKKPTGKDTNSMLIIF